MLTVLARDSMEETKGPSPLPGLKARSCWYYGCFTIGMMILIVVLSIYLGGRYFLKTFVSEYTSEAGIDLPKSALSETNWESLRARVQTFLESLERTNGAVWLELSSDEINALIERDPHLQVFKGRLYVTLESETARCQFSYPLEGLGAHAILHGRYLNGKAQLVPNLVNGKIYLTLLNIEVNGKTVPDTVKPGLQAHNLMQTLNDDSASQAVIHHLSGITIQKGKILVAAKGAHVPP